MCSQKSSEAAGSEASWLAGCLRSLLSCCCRFCLAIFQSFNRVSAHLGRFLAAKARHRVAPEFLVSSHEMTGKYGKSGNERQKRACMNVYCILFDSICIMDRLWHSQFFLTDPDLVQKCSMMCSLQILPRTLQVFSCQVSGQTQRPNTRPAWRKVIGARKPQTIFPPEISLLSFRPCARKGDFNHQALRTGLAHWPTTWMKLAGNLKHLQKFCPG